MPTPIRRSEEPMIVSESPKIGKVGPGGFGGFVQQSRQPYSQ
jgi:hypothetical protein